MLTALGINSPDPLVCRHVHTHTHTYTHTHTHARTQIHTHTHGTHTHHKTRKKDDLACGQNRFKTQSSPRAIYIHRQWASLHFSVRSDKTVKLGSLLSTNM